MVKNQRKCFSGRTPTSVIVPPFILVPWTLLLNLSRSVYRLKNELDQKRRALSCMDADVLRLTDSRFSLQNPSCRTNQITSASSSSSMLLRLLESSFQA